MVTAHWSMLTSHLPLSLALGYVDKFASNLSILNRLKVNLKHTHTLWVRQVEVDVNPELARLSARCAPKVTGN